MGTRVRAARCTQHRLELRFAHARRSHMRARRCCGRTKHSASALVDDLITGLLRRGDVRRVPSCRNLRRRTRGAAGGHQRQKPYYLSHCCPPLDRPGAAAYDAHHEDEQASATSEALTRLRHSQDLKRRTYARRGALELSAAAGDIHRTSVRLRLSGSRRRLAARRSCRYRLP
jgi:hypothetical protein